jgi:DNA invertase Pin-like site-specific DNA recombinase
MTLAHQKQRAIRQLIEILEREMWAPPGGARANEHKLSLSEAQQARRRIDGGENSDAVAHSFGMSRTTLYRHLRKLAPVRSGKAAHAVQSINATTAADTLISDVTRALVEFDRALIGESSRAGLAAAKARDAQIGRPTKSDFPYVEKNTTRGTVYYYYRRGRGPRIPLPRDRKSGAFAEAYQRARKLTGGKLDASL